jgi:uncharacterized membrane protein
MQAFWRGTWFELPMPDHDPQDTSAKQASVATHRTAAAAVAKSSAPPWCCGCVLANGWQPRGAADLPGIRADGGPGTGRRRFAAKSVAALALALALCAGSAGAVGAASPVVRAVLFFVPHCGHCEHVIYQVLPGLFADVGGVLECQYDERLPVGEVAFQLMTNGRLEILLVNTSVPEGAELYRTTIDVLALPPGGVPRLIVGNQHLVGSVDIAKHFPAFVLGVLDAGGIIDWPTIPGLAAALESVSLGSGPVDSVTTGAVPAGGTSISPLRVAAPSVWDRFGQDPVANSMSVAVLTLMVAASVGSALRMRRSEEAGPLSGVVPVLALAGLGIAAYLTFVEVGGSEAVCGPVGDCNTVQQSGYARLFGVIHIGVLGVVGYSLALVTWGVTRLARGRLADGTVVVLFAGVVSGVLLSGYLTFLEPFVIGSSCAWCLASAVMIAGLMLVTARPAATALSRIRASPRGRPQGSGPPMES